MGLPLIYKMLHAQLKVILLVLPSLYRDLTFSLQLSFLLSSKTPHHKTYFEVFPFPTAISFPDSHSSRSNRKALVVPASIRSSVCFLVIEQLSHTQSKIRFFSSSIDFPLLPLILSIPTARGSSLRLRRVTRKTPGAVSNSGSEE